MTTMAVQLNTRIDPSLKAGGDAVLARNGINPSDAVRALWRYLAEKQVIPPFMRQERRAIEQPDLAEEGFGLACVAMHQNPTANLNPAATEYEQELDDMRDDMYDAMLRDIEENCQ